MKLNMNQVREIWRTDSFDIYWATQAQIDKLCDELGHDRPQMRWDNCQEEMACMIADVRMEFE